MCKFSNLLHEIVHMIFPFEVFFSINWCASMTCSQGNTLSIKILKVPSSNLEIYLCISLAETLPLLCLSYPHSNEPYWSKRSQDLPFQLISQLSLILSIPRPQATPFKPNPLPHESTNVNTRWQLRSTHRAQIHNPRILGRHI